MLSIWKFSVSVFKYLPSLQAQNRHLFSSFWYQSKCKTIPAPFSEVGASVLQLRVLTNQKLVVATKPVKHCERAWKIVVSLVLVWYHLVCLCWIIYWRTKSSGVYVAVLFKMQSHSWFKFISRKPEIFNLSIHFTSFQ